MATINDLQYFSFLIEGYRITDQATKSTDVDVIYFGYTDRLGNHYIMVNDTSAGANNLQTYRFYKGATSSGYTTAWAARESLTYDYFYNIFNT